MDGLLLTIHIDEAHPSTQMDEPLLFTMTSPSLHYKQTGSFLQFSLTSSTLNSDGRAPTIYINEPFTALQNGRAPSYNSYWRGSPLNTDGRAPTIHSDEPFVALQTDGLLLTIHIDEVHPSTQMDEPLLFTVTSPSLHSKPMGSFLQFSLTSSTLNSDGRAPTIYINEPFTALQNGRAPSYNSH